MAATIRLAEPADADRLTVLTDFVHGLHLAARQADFKPLVTAELAEWFRAQTANPAVRIWIAECEGRAVGYASASIVQRGAAPFGPERRWLELDGIVVAPDSRRGGIGRALIGAVIEQARAEGITRVEATTWWFNDEAREAFGRLGFTPKFVRFERGTTP